MITLEELAQQLRAVADERRLRLLQLCADGPAAVSALAAALGDGEPNVSRQLKQLAAAGLVRRSRQGQFVEYSLAVPPAGAAETVQWLLGRLGGDDPALRIARGALRRSRLADAARTGAARGLAAESRFGRTLASALAGPAAADAAGRRVLLRARYPELVSMLAGVTGELALVVGSTVERAALRRWVTQRGLDVEVDLPDAFTARAARRGWDLVVLDDGLRPQPAAPSRPQAGAATLEADCALARRLLAPQGRAWLMADYDALDAPAAAGASGAAPPQRLRGLLLAASLECQQLLPVEAEGRHVLIARTAPLRSVAKLARSA